MHKSFLSIAAFLGALAVGLGAFGAHGLKKIVPPESVATFQTGAQYQMYHALALLAVGILYEKFSSKWMQWAGNCFIAGVLLFSGSLYLLTLFKATETVGLEKFGIITPFGGMAFILGWFFLLLGVIRRPKG